MTHAPLTEESYNRSVVANRNMGSNDDPKGYYRALGLAPNASQAQIIHAYREWAKRFHPDLQGTADASDFRRIKEAYDVLGDPLSRRRYDSSCAGASAPTQQRTERDGKPDGFANEKVDAVRCCLCGVVSAQPRYCVFHRVVSFFVYTHTAEIAGVYCATCAKKVCLRETMICWLFGWWSLAGIFQTPAALWRNLFIGEKPSLSNARLLAQQGSYFRQQRQFDLAHACFEQGKVFADDETLRTLYAVEQDMPCSPSSMKDQWQRASLTTCVQMIPIMLVIGVSIWYGSLLRESRDARVAPSAASPSKPISDSASTTPRDMRYVVVAQTQAWSLERGSYASAGMLPQFSTIHVSRIAPDPQFVVGETLDGRTVTVAASALASGDGFEARMHWCRAQFQTPPINNEILKRSGGGRNRVVIQNLGRFDAVAKLRDANGAVAVAIFVSANSTASFDEFPDGSFRLEFATGHEWSRRCNMFIEDMRAQKFPDYDKFAAVSVGQGRYRYSEYTYTITPVPTGNVQAEPLSLDAFETDN